MPSAYIAANWKMNTTVDEAAALASGVRKGFDPATNVEIILCPPFISLSAVRKAVDGTNIKVGAQNMYFEGSGAFTGEISPSMLKGICDYVILGHSERRQIFGETDELVNLKVRSAQEAGLRPIFCVGETLEERKQGRASQVVGGQVQAGLKGIPDITDILVAYEPLWAIGTGQAATPEIAAEIMGGTIFGALQQLFGGAANNVPLLYGGSVNSGNVAGFVGMSCTHGALVGGASLQVDQFLHVVQTTADASR